ncbi:MAG: alpha-1,2-fucosyltransferase [Nitrospirota bacterium]
MVIVFLIGGLGNQLFQYAFARKIAYMNEVPLKLDISGFQSYRLHRYSLQHFNIIEDIASINDIMSIRGSGSIVREKAYYFDPDMLQVPKDVYLEGYWQSAKYFDDIENVIRHEFTLRSAPDAVNEKMAQEILSVNAVSVHIRRCDYVSNPHTNRVHGICPADYYYSAIEKVTKIIDKPCFFVFSDDPAWAFNNLRLEYPTSYMTNNGPDRNYEDLWLMSLCKHHITANSTFSWWGAWLSANPEKIVISPKKWFASQELDPKDLIPESWQRL